MATAAVPAGTFLQVLRGGNAPQLKRLADELLHLLLQALHFMLGVDEPFGHRIAQEGVALGIKRGDFSPVQRQTLMLAFVQGAALLVQALVKLLRAAVGHKGIDPLANALKLRLPDNGFAQLQSLLPHLIFD
jgi:hypothetical protein